MGGLSGVEPRKPDESAFQTGNILILQQHVPSKRFAISAQHGRPASVAEWHRRYDAIVEKKRKNIHGLLRLLLSLTTISVAIMLFSAERRIMVFAHVITYGPIGFAAYKFARGDLQTLEQQYADWLTELQANSPAGEAVR